MAIRATHAEHESSRGPLSAQSASLGYVVEGSASVYFAGDTDLFDGMAELGPIDAGVLPVSGLGPAAAGRPPRPARRGRGAAPAAAADRGADPLGHVQDAVRARRPDDRPAREFEQAAAELAPEVEVRVLAIGETLALEVAR